jgi:hypothetical protein
MLFAIHVSATADRQGGAAALRGAAHPKPHGAALPGKGGGSNMNIMCREVIVQTAGAATLPHRKSRRGLSYNPHYV